MQDNSLQRSEALSGESPSFVITPALPADSEELLALAGHLNTVNLPAERAAVAALLQHSADSFNGVIADVRKRKYVFLLRELANGKAVATSSIVAQLGRRDAPYVYFDVLSEEKYSLKLDLHFDHLALRLGASFDGPTELAGLVVDPSYRKRPEKLGLCISYVRLLFIAAHPELFQEVLLAELLPPLEPDGTSHLWNAVGRRFTNMSYLEADRLSHLDKDFIRDLFPTGIVYASLLDDAAQSVIGEVGAQTLGVEKMLRRIGFYYGDRVDPFDGGPHFFAEREKVTPIQRFRRAPAVAATPEATRCMLALVARDRSGSLHFRATPTHVELSEEGARVSRTVLEVLEAEAGDPLLIVPIP